MPILILADDDLGVPIHFGTAESVGVTTVDSNAKSGNPAHDVASGKFGSTTNGKPTQDRTPDASPDQLALARRADAVREAARTKDGISLDGIKAFLSERGNKEFTDAEVNQFFADTVTQRMNDLVDSLDNSLRKLEVGMVAPDGWTKDRIIGLDDAQLQQLQHRLEAKGWDQSDIEKHILSNRKTD